MFCCSDQPVNLCPLDPLKLCLVQSLLSFIIQFFIYKHMPYYGNHLVCYMCYCYMMTMSFSKRLLERLDHHATIIHLCVSVLTMLHCLVFAGAVIGWRNRWTRVNHLLVVKFNHLLMEQKMINNRSTYLTNKMNI